ncbi:MAG: AraC family transcriptional regulator [Pleurocapsa sp. MO_226.B13]|nr:AraC family transcriptional regulator [Pleurocapsa sp. MO_226.B13]
MPASKSLIIDSTKEEDMLQIYPCPSLLSSSNLHWDRIHLGYYRIPPHSISEKISKQHLILIHPQLPLKINVEQKFGKRWEKNHIQDGDIIIIPANTPHQASWDREHSYIRLSLEPEKLAHLTPLIDLDPIELVPCFQKADPLILGIGLALKTEVESKGMGGHLYIDSLTNTLAVHLLRHYARQKFPITENTAGLPKYKLQQVIEYINDQIERNFTLAELAAIANMSPNYFSYLFKLSTGYAPHQYVIRLRVERAKKLLLQEKLTIADIAYSLGFAHQSHLNRHFKRLVGVTPKVFQKQK